MLIFSAFEVNFNVLGGELLQFMCDKTHLNNIIVAGLESITVVWRQEYEHSYNQSFPE